MKFVYEQTIEQVQKLVMTPDLIQAIRILQFNTQELDEYVQEELLSNPVMEMASESVDRFSNMSVMSKNSSKDVTESGDFPMEKFAAAKKETLAEHLLFQLETADLKEKCRERGRYIIEALDENGYLTMDTDEIAHNLGTTRERVQKTIEVIQSFDPVGVGARNLKECLLIQLDSIMKEFEESGKNQCVLEDYYLTEIVIRDYLEDLGANKINSIAKAIGVSVQKIQEIADIIRRLEPKPGRQFSEGYDSHYIIPDITVEKVDGKYIVAINETSVPRLMLGSYYGKLQEEAQNDPEMAKYLAKKVNSALWLIKSIDQRKNTIFNVASAIVKYQHSFFEEGPKCLKALTLKQIADEVDIHESTVSRAINGKYMETPRGVFELKYFFKSGVAKSACESGSEENISSMGVKSFIREMVEGEDPKSPKSDQDMVSILREKGIDISRRTVAKYRDEMGILSSSKRRRY